MVPWNAVLIALFVTLPGSLPGPIPSIHDPLPRIEEMSSVLRPAPRLFRNDFAREMASFRALSTSA